MFVWTLFVALGLLALASGCRHFTVAGHFVALGERARWTSKGQARSQASLAVSELKDGRVFRASYYPVVEKH